MERRALASVTFQTAVMSTADMVAETLEGWAVDLDHLGKLSRWPKIRRALAERYEIAPSQVDRLAPGAAKHWRRLVTEARRGKAGWRKIQRLTGFQRSTTTHDPSEA